MTDDQTKREHWINSMQYDIVAELHRSNRDDAKLNIERLIEQYITNIWTELDGDEPVQPSRYDTPDDWREGKLR